MEVTDLNIEKTGTVTATTDNTKELLCHLRSTNNSYYKLKTEIIGVLPTQIT